MFQSFGNRHGGELEDFAPKAIVPQIFFVGKLPQILGTTLSKAHISSYVLKFNGDRPTELGDIALQSARKKTTAVKH